MSKREKLLVEKLELKCNHAVDIIKGVYCMKISY